MVKKFVSLLLVIFLIATLFAACKSNAPSTTPSTTPKTSDDQSKPAPEPAEKIVWKIGLTVPEEHPYYKVAIRFGELLEEKSQGRLGAEVYGSETLGAEKDVLKGIAMGTADITTTGSAFEEYTKSAALTEAPWLFKDEEHVKKFIASELGEKLYQDFKDVGYIPIIYILRSARMLTSNVPVHNVDDVKGLKLRVPNSALSVSVWTATGAAPTVIPLNETFMAISNGVADTQENPYDLIYSCSFYEVQKYVNETEHSVPFNLFVLGKNQYDSLSADLQQIVLDAAAEVQEYCDQLYWENKDYYKNLCVEKGMIINTDVDKESFRAAMMPELEQYFSPEIWQFYKEIAALG